jgi:hypothetical protein
MVVFWQSYTTLGSLQAAYAAVEDLRLAVESAESTLQRPLIDHSRVVDNIVGPFVSHEHQPHMIQQTVAVAADQVPSLKSVINAHLHFHQYYGSDFTTRSLRFSRTNEYSTKHVQGIVLMVHSNERDVAYAVSTSHPDNNGMHSTVPEPSLETNEVQIPLINRGHRDEGSIATLNTSQSLRDENFGGDEKHIPAIGYNPIDNVRAPIEVIREMTPWSAKYRFPAPSECEMVKEKADALPDMVVVPFEDAVSDTVLDGWEDVWVSKARYTGPKLKEPKIDFVYNCEWMHHLPNQVELTSIGVNGSQPELIATMHPYEVNSTLNDEDGVWLASHGSNRYREWDELRYSMRSVEKYAGSFANRIQILVNAFEIRSPNGTYVVNMGKQRPKWLKDVEQVQILSQEEFFGPDEKKCLPSFDSLTIENQLYNTKSDTDRVRSFFVLVKHIVGFAQHCCS